MYLKWKQEVAANETELDQKGFLKGLSLVMNTSVRALVTHYIAVPEEDSLHDIIEMESYLEGENDTPHFLRIQEIEEEDLEVNFNPIHIFSFQFFHFMFSINIYFPFKSISEN